MIESTSTRGGRYDAVTQGLHWLLFALVALQFIVAWLMPDVGPETKAEGLFKLHLSIGAPILCLAVAKILWRLTHPFARNVSTDPIWRQMTARWVHICLLALLIVIPALGWIAAAMWDYPVTMFGLVRMPRVVASDTFLGIEAPTIGDLHTALSFLMLALIGMHLAGALYHVFVLRDRVFQRMLPGND